MSGDCGFFSGTARLLPEISDMDYESCLWNFFSCIFLFKKIGISWQNMKFVSLHGMDSNIVRHAAENEKTFFFSRRQNYSGTGLQTPMRIFHE